jgi:hypothetical protein
LRAPSSHAGGAAEAGSGLVVSASDDSEPEAPDPDDAALDGGGLGGAMALAFSQSLPTQAAGAQTPSSLASGAQLGAGSVVAAFSLRAVAPAPEIGSEPGADGSTRSGSNSSRASVQANAAAARAPARQSPAAQRVKEPRADTRWLRTKVDMADEESIISRWFVTALGKRRSGNGTRTPTYRRWLRESRKARKPREALCCERESPYVTEREPMKCAAGEQACEASSGREQPAQCMRCMQCLQCLKGRHP